MILVSGIMVLHCHFTFDFAVLFYIDHAVYKLCSRELTSFYFDKYLCIVFIYFGGGRITFSGCTHLLSVCMHACSVCTLKYNK